MSGFLGTEEMEVEVGRGYLREGRGRGDWTDEEFGEFE